jgi:hypothetical protein
MARIKTDQLQPGMVVVSDVKNMDDMLLLPAGCELSERHIRILRAWGIADVPVDGCGDDSASPGAASAEPAVFAPERVAQLKTRFWRWNEDDLVQREIIRVLLRRKSHPFGSPSKA